MKQRWRLCYQEWRSKKGGVLRLSGGLSGRSLRLEPCTCHRGRTSQSLHLTRPGGSLWTPHTHNRYEAVSWVWVSCWNSESRSSKSSFISGTKDFCSSTPRIANTCPRICSHLHLYLYEMRINVNICCTSPFTVTPPKFSALTLNIFGWETFVLLVKTKERYIEVDGLSESLFIQPFFSFF